MSFIFAFAGFSILLSQVAICFCDSPDIEVPSSVEEQKLGLDESKLGQEKTSRSNESSTPSRFSRIYDFPIIQTRIFTLRTSHVLSGCLYAVVYMGGVDFGVNLVFDKSYIPLIKKLIESPHRVFMILDEQSIKDKFVRRAIDLACKIKDNETP